MESHPTPDECLLAYGPNTHGLCEWDGRAVPEGRTQWCSVGCSAAWLDAHNWPRARAAALRRTARRCQVCRAQPVHVHHLAPTETYAPSCSHHADNLLVLCPEHHAHEHSLLRAKPGAQLALFRAA